MRNVNCIMSTYAGPLNRENDLKLEGPESISEGNIMVRVATEGGCIVSSARAFMRKI